MFSKQDIASESREWYSTPSFSNFANDTQTDIKIDKY